MGATTTRRSCIAGSTGAENCRPLLRLDYFCAFLLLENSWTSEPMQTGLERASD